MSTLQLFTLGCLAFCLGVGIMLVRWAYKNHQTRKQQQAAAELAAKRYQAHQKEQAAPKDGKDYYLLGARARGIPKEHRVISHSGLRHSNRNDDTPDLPITEISTDVQQGVSSIIANARRTEANDRHAKIPENQHRDDYPAPPSGNNDWSPSNYEAGGSSSDSGGGGSSGE